MFKKFYTDNIIIKKPTGDVVDKIKGDIQNGKQAFFQTNQLVEPGDILLREIGEHFEEYIIIEPGYHTAFHGIPAGYQATIERKNKISSPSKTSITNNYNMHGHNNRINNNSIDNSSNIIQQHDSIKEIIDAISAAKLEIKTSTLNSQDIEISNKLLDLVETQINTENTSFIQTLLSALPITAQALPSVIKIIEILSK